MKKDLSVCITLVPQWPDDCALRGCWYWPRLIMDPAYTPAKIVPTDNCICRQLFLQCHKNYNYDSPIMACSTCDRLLVTSSAIVALLCKTQELQLCDPAKIMHFKACWCPLVLATGCWWLLLLWPAMSQKLCIWWPVHGIFYLCQANSGLSCCCCMPTWNTWSDDSSMMLQ